MPAQRSDAITTSPHIGNILHLHNPYIQMPACVFPTFFKASFNFFLLNGSFKIDLNRGRLDAIGDLDGAGIWRFFLAQSHQ